MKVHDLSKTTHTTPQGDMVKAEKILVLEGRGTYKLRVVPEGVEHRREMMGEMVTDQFAFLTAQPTVIAATPVSEHYGRVNVAIGDHLKIAGLGEWVITEGGTKHQPKIVLERFYKVWKSR
jgi:hypothetical protein